MANEKEIKYTTPEQQIALLKNRNLIINDVAKAKQHLEVYGYYNIINGYKNPYIQPGDDTNSYRDGASFEQIYSLFTLDHNLRNSIMAAMLDLEERLRAAAAEVVAQSFGVDHNEYLQWNNYRDRKTTPERFGLKGILATLGQNVKSDKDPIRHYRERYGIVPPWILFKGTYFSTLVNFIRLFKGPQKAAMISIMYDMPEKESNLACMKNLITDTLFVCLNYRNLAAHGGRIFNFESHYEKAIKDNISLYENFPSLNHIKDLHGLSMLYALLRAFAYKQPYNILANSLNRQLDRHLNQYPDDKRYLEETLGLTIHPQRYVWISSKSHKYHSSPTCSGMISTTRMRYEDAVSDSSYCPCRRCMNE